MSVLRCFVAHAEILQGNRFLQLLSSVAVRAQSCMSGPTLCKSFRPLSDVCNTHSSQPSEMPSQTGSLSSELGFVGAYCKSGPVLGRHCTTQCT